MSDVSWMALALALTVCGGLWTWHAFRTRGTASGVRGVSLTLLPVAAWLTGTLEMLGEVAGSVADWAVGFVFSPLVWIGIALFVLSVVLFGVSTKLGAGRARTDRKGSRRREVADSDTEGALPGSAAGKGAPAIDDDLADIEAILKRRGIS